MNKKGFTLAEVFHPVRRSKKIAFTLAEVLITLGIIGMVATLTLPSLIQRYQEKQTVSALKKFYSTISQAFEMAKLNYGDPENWAAEKTEDGKGSEEFISHLKPYLKIIQDCQNDRKGCFSNQVYKKLEGTDSIEYNTLNGHSKFVLSNGENISFFLNSAECKYKTEVGNTPHLKNICGGLHVDINGHNKPNGYGRDLFLFYITKYGIIPAGTAEDNTEYAFTKSCDKNQTVSYSSGNGKGCTAWVIFKENMDYLHCNDLSWTGKSKCK